MARPKKREEDKAIRITMSLDRETIAALEFLKKNRRGGFVPSEHVRRWITEEAVKEGWQPAEYLKVD